MNISIMDALRKTVASIKDFTNDGLNKKVDKNGNKKLSDENYSTTEKNKVANMATGLVVLDDVLYLKTDNGYMSETGIDLSQYGNGGGASSGEIVTLTNKLNGNVVTVVSGSPINLTFDFILEYSRLTMLR